MFIICNCNWNNSHTNNVRLFFSLMRNCYVSRLRTHKMTWYTRPWQPDISASRLLLMDPTFLQVRKVSVAISKRGYTNLTFIVPGAKIKRQYYREVLLKQELLSVIQHC